MQSVDRELFPHPTINLPIMKIRLLFSLLMLALVATPIVRAQPKPADEEETELGGKMDKLNKAFRALGRNIKDASKNADSLAQVAIIREMGEAAAKLTPAMAADIPADKRDKFVADYKAGMKAFLEEVGKLEAALKANDNVAAAKIADSLKTMRNDSHKQFKRPDKKK